MRYFLFCALTALVASATPIQAQSSPDWDPRGLKMERSELLELRERLDAVAQSTGYSARVRDRARRDAELLEERLERGDFRAGDRVLLRVEGEPEIPPDLPVLPGPRISLPVWGSISLDGVLRSELQEHLTREIARFRQNPQVEAESLVRLSIQGNVNNPGFYTVPADMLVGDALMQAGGPGANADLEGMRIERTGERLWEGTALRDVIAEGRTLDQLNLRAGDQIVVPERGESAMGNFFRWGLPLISLALGIVTLSR